MRIYTLFNLLIGIVSAVFLDEAFRTDYHYALLGTPVAERTFFHQPDPSSRATLLYTLSSRGVLGAVHPKDGSLVWRQQLSRNFSSGDAAGVKGAGEVIYAAVGNEVSAWSAAEGKLVWRKTLEGNVAPRSVGSLSGDAVVAFGGGGGGARVKVFDAVSGIEKWSFVDTSKDEVYGLKTAGGKLFYITLQKAMLKGFKIKITTLDAESGKQTDSYTLSSDSDVYGPEDIVYLGSENQAPIIVWTDKTVQTLKVNILGTKQEHTFPTKRNNAEAASVRIVSSATKDKTMAFLAHYRSDDRDWTESNRNLENWADVFSVDHAKGKVSKLHEHPADPGRGAFAAQAVDTHVFFTRASQTGGYLYTSASKSAFRSWDMPPALVSTSTATDMSAEPISATSEIVLRGDDSYAVRSAFLLSNGDWIMARGGEVDWVRHEGLADIVTARWGEYRTETPLVEDLKKEEHSDPVTAFIHRIRRHVEAVQAAPSFFQQLPGQVTEWVQSFTKRNGTTLTKRDTFGINKVIVAATADGRAIMIDPAQRGKIRFNFHMVKVPSGQLLNETSAAAVFDKLQSPSTKEALVFPGQLVYPGLFNSVKSTMGSDVSFGIVNGRLQGSQGGNIVWHYSPLSGERILHFSAQYPSEPLASIGKVLGDRNVLYKYINPNAIVLVSADEEKHTATVTLLDSVSGSVIHSTHLNDVDTSRPLPAVVSENWYAFFYATDAGEENLSKGYQVVMSELYESDIPNDRGPLGAATNYSSAEPKLGRLQTSKPYVVSQVFHVPEEVSHLAVTQTGQGITTRHLLATLSRSGSIVSIPRGALDPRRIVDKDPTSEQAEEGLSRYNPFIHFDPQWVLNHKQEVLGINNVLTAPSLLESTSLVFAYGLDVFGTRVAPSFAFDVLGDDFNKIQLLITVVALTATTFLVAPLIERKQVNALWQSV